MTLYIQSPFRTEMVVKDMSIEILNDEESITLELQDEVVIPPEEKKELQLVGDELPQSDIGMGEMEMEIEMELEIELLGITMEMSR